MPLANKMPYVQYLYFKQYIQNTNGIFFQNQITLDWLKLVELGCPVG